MSSAETVRVWDAWDREMKEEVEAWDTWEKVKEVKGFPGGLIAFLQTSTDSDGCGFQNPTIVQAYSWPILQSGKDLVGVAKTGSGKTLAFLLPGFIKLRKLKKAGEVDTSRGPALLTMTPTRELCHQIYSDAEKFGKPVQITAACAYGGQPKRDQEWALRQGPDCLIATPGRLNDFLENRSVDLSQVRFAILDEADRMLDMGFEPQIRKIMDNVPNERQTAMFTATWPRECKRLAENYIKNPVQIQIGSDDITTNRNIRQHVEVCSDDKAKREALKRILGYLGHTGNCLVFCNTKRKCRDLSWELEGDRDLRLPAVELHGDLDQRARDSALNRFRSGEVRVLVATDVAARGLDIRNISIVVNYDAPNDAEGYVHRIGRTGRAGDMGDAYTFLASWGEEKKAANIITIMEKALQEVPQALRDLVGGRGGGGGGSWGGGGDSWKADDAKKDDKWGSSDKGWDKKDEWSKDDWKKDDEWSKKDDWKKDDEWSKKDDWKKDDWKKDDEKKDDWKKDDGKKDDWKKDDGKKDDDWKKDDKWWEKKDDWKKAEPTSWKEASKDDRPEEVPEEDGGAPMEDTHEPGALINLLGTSSSSKRPAAEEQEPDAEPPEKRPRTEEKEAEVGADAEMEPEAAGGADDATAKEADAKEADAKEADAKEADAKEADAKEADAKEADAKEADAKEADAEEADAKEAGADEAAAAPAAEAADGAAGEAGADDEPEQDPTSVEALVQAGQGTRLKVGDLKGWLEERGLPTSGVKTTLIERVQEFLADKH